VELSRNTHHKFIIFVGNKERAAERLWKTLCQTNQWTALTEAIINNLAITVDGDRPAASKGVIDIADNFPWRIADQFLPCSNSGFVYLLVSTPSPSRTYVGTTKNMAVRINQHNRGYGSAGTASPEFLPWAVVSYITNMSNISRPERMGLERQWQLLNASSLEVHMGGMEQYIENGRRVVVEHNELNEQFPDRCLNYVILAQRRYALELADMSRNGQETIDDTSMDDEIDHGKDSSGDSCTEMEDDDGVG